jgi:hypothetical protein
MATELAHYPHACSLYSPIFSACSTKKTINRSRGPFYY